MRLFEKAIEEQFSKMLEENILIKFVGDLKMFPKKLQKLIAGLERKSRDKKGKRKIKVFLAASYGGRNEIINGIKKLSKELAKKDIEKITEKKFEKYLYTADILDPEIIIRTGGDTRLSNFLM